MAEYEQIVQPFAPVFDDNAKVLILGSLPSVKSREQGFYYGHPQNRFWRVIAGVYGVPVPESIPQKKEMLSQWGIALWDVIERCQIKGSSDSTIKDVVPADLNIILGRCSIEKIFANGKTAGRLYEKFSIGVTGQEIIELPSTSPANAAYSLEKLIQGWSLLKE